MRLRGITGPFFSNHAGINGLSKSVGNFFSKSSLPFPGTILYINNIGLQYNRAGGILTDVRNTAATVVDWEGNVLAVLPNEIRYSGARRVDHADGIMYNAGIPSIEYLNTQDDGVTPIDPKPMILHEPAGDDPVTGPRAQDSIRIPLVVGSNFIQSGGMLIFRMVQLEPTIEGSRGLVSLITTALSLLYEHNTLGSFATYDGVNLASINIGGQPAGTQTLFCILWDTASSSLSLCASIDNGVSWTTWVNKPYDGAYATDVNIRFFISNSISNKMDLVVITSKIPRGTMEESQEWVEEYPWAEV